MKKIYFSILVIYLLRLSSATAQTVDSIYYTPAVPSNGDSITFYINCYFTYSGCEGTAIYWGGNGDTITASALHCMGMLAALCYDEDTVIVPPMPPGQYTFMFILSTGTGPTCLEGPIPPDTQYVSFSVTPGAGIVSPDFENGMMVLPNPSHGDLVVSWQNSSVTEGTLKVYNTLGALQQMTTILPGTKRMQLNLPPGLYFLVNETGNGKITGCRALVY